MTDNKASKHGPEQHTEADKSKPSDKVLPGAAITKPADNIVQRQAQAREAVKSYKLTNDSQQSFSIRDEHGREIKDSRARKQEKPPAAESHKSAEKSHVSYGQHQQDVESATRRCVDEATAKWGKQNVQDIKLNKDDLNAALALSLLGPGVYKAIGHERAEAIGKTVIEHCAPTVHEVVKTFNPPVPKNLEHVKSNAEDDKKLEAAGHVFIDSCKNTFGEEKVAALHIEPKDWSAAIGLFMVGPDAYKAMGHDRAQSLGKQTLLFGIAPAMGAAEEAKRAMHDLPALGVEGSVNALLGYGAGFVTKLFPSTAIPLAIGGGAMVAKEQLDPKTQAQNQQIWGINRSADQMNNSQILAAAKQTENIIGPALFHGLFSTVTAGAGFAHGEQTGTAVKEALSHGGIKQAMAEVATTLHKDGGGIVNDTTINSPTRGGAEIARPHDRHVKAAERREPAHILGTPEKHVEVEKIPMGFKYKIDGDEHVLREFGHWTYGGCEGRKFPSTSLFESPGIKLHVETISNEDLVSVQKVLIPALDKDPELARLVPEWKTDTRGLTGQGAESVNRKGQDAKGFTLYVKDPDKAQYVMEKIDGLLDKQGLDLKHRIDSGNVDSVSGKTNRVGICREKWEPATMPGRIDDGSRSDGALLGSLLEGKMKARYGAEKFSPDQLRIIEHESGIKIGTLAYDDKGKLMLRATSEHSGSHGRSRNGFYLTEGGSNDEYGHLTDRPAMYALAKHFNVDQVDSFLADQKTIVRMALKPGEETTLHQRIPSLNQPGEAEKMGLNPALNLKVGIDKIGGYVVDDKQAIYTWNLIARGRGQSLPTPTLVRHEPGTVVRIEPHQVVRLGSEKGPYLDIFNENNEISVPRAKKLNRDQVQKELALKSAPDGQNFNRVVFEGRQVSVNKSELVIGRTKGDLLLGESELTSGQHAAMRIDAAGRVHIRDLNSTNGTFVNGVKLASHISEKNNETVLRPGDRVGIPHPNSEFIFTGLKDAPLQRYSSKDVLEYKFRPGETNSVTETPAVRQSQQLQSGYELATPLLKGFQDIPNGSAVNGEGLVVKGYPTTVFDPDRDQRLRTLFKSAHAQFDNLRNQGQEKELRRALAELAHDSLTPKGKWSDEEIDIAYKRFLSENRGKQILLGEYLRQADQNIGGGVCAQQTLMYKALCNEFGLDTKIVRGHVEQLLSPKVPSATDFQASHTWAVDIINGREVVFDPRARTHGADRAAMPHYFDGKEIAKPALTTEPQFKKSPFAKHSDVIFNNGEWKFEGIDQTSGDYIISQALEKKVSMRDFQELNGQGTVPSRNSDKYPRLPALYKVARSSGKIEEDWQFDRHEASSRPGQPGYYVLRRVQTVAVPPHTVQPKTQ